jgi:hypothetical protein
MKKEDGKNIQNAERCPRKSYTDENNPQLHINGGDKEKFWRILVCLNY